MKTIMISSTVQDFKDARKILKEELKKAGYNVIISEDGSIITDSRAETYDDCFKAVESSDFIIFLVGIVSPLDPGYVFLALLVITLLTNTSVIWRMVIASRWRLIERSGKLRR